MKKILSVLLIIFTFRADLNLILHAFQIIWEDIIDNARCDCLSVTMLKVVTEIVKKLQIYIDDNCIVYLLKVI